MKRKARKKTKGFSKKKEMKHQQKMGKLFLVGVVLIAVYLIIQIISSI